MSTGETYVDEIFGGYRKGGLIFNQGRGKAALCVAWFRDLDNTPWVVGYDTSEKTHFMAHPSHWLPSGPKVLRKEGEVFITDGPGSRSTKVLPPLAPSKL